MTTRFSSSSRHWQELVDRLDHAPGLTKRPGPGHKPNTGHALEPDDLEPDERHTVELTTPTGHRHRSTAPPVIPGLPRARLHYATPETSPLETYLERLLAAD
ncbi:hypothetical protein [Lapillicoccus sp.]|uniref:hypothetical protein n=1 Tax=Lapillicoccus sp. TaxID=1909287 RepID=UPI003263520F